MSDGIPFGAGAASMLDGLSPDLIARLLQAQQPQQAAPSPVDSLLFDRAGMGAPDNGFSGSSGTIVRPQPPQVAQPAPAPGPQATGAIPQAAPAAAAPEAPAPAPMPAPPARPSELSTLAVGMQPVSSFDPLTGQPVSGMPKAVAAPAQSAAPSSGLDLGGMFGRLSDPRIYNTLLGIGAGILQGKNFGEGLGQGIENAQRMNAQQGATDLQQLKLQREQAALTGNAQILKRAYPNLSDAELGAMATNSANVTTALQILRDPTHGMPKTPAQMEEEAAATARGSMTGGAKPLDRLQSEAQAQAAGTMAGTAKPLDRIEAEAKAQSAGAAAGKPDETYTTLSEADRIARGLPPGAYQVDSKNKVSPINPTGTTINMGNEKAFDAEVGKAYAKQYTDLQNSDRNARNKLNTLALMEQSMNTPGFYSGVGGDGVKRANQFLGALGFKDAKAASGAEVFDALGNQVVLDQLGGSLGAGISDSDRKSIALIGPSISKTPEGNKQLIGIYRSIAQREQQIAQMARDYAKANGGRIDAGFDDQVAQFANANPLFPAAQGGATAQSDGVSGPTGIGGLAAPRTQADFDALPKGSMYVDPADGRRYRKD